MARYKRDYGLDYGRWRPSPPSGGMRSDGWGGTGDWRQFAGEEGWYGEGYEGMPGFAYDFEIREPEGWRLWAARRYGAGRSGGYGRARGVGYGAGYAGDYGGYGGLWGEAGYPDIPQRAERGYGRDVSRGYPRDFPSGPQGYTGRGWGAGRPDAATTYSEGWEDSWGGAYERGRGSTFGRGMTRAADIMTENPEVVTPDATLTEVARKMRDLDVGIIPVVDDEQNRRLRGVITDRDIAVRAVAEGKGGNVKVSECMTPRVRSVNKNDSVQDVMRIMRQDQVRRVPVTDREGRLVGIIAQADLAVDYGADDWNREREVEETLERISRPAEPAMRGAQRGSAMMGSAAGGSGVRAAGRAAGASGQSSGSAGQKGRASVRSRSAAKDRESGTGGGGTAGGEIGNR